ncbi:hypothetical protein [Primorskyibacter sedentarius]|uniref:hypothetical protein n=1 Tax=Primorskyibacter sedentarius TaxID=745311 RepID=UPI003EBB7776
MNEKLLRMLMARRGYWEDAAGGGDGGGGGGADGDGGGTGGGGHDNGQGGGQDGADGDSDWRSTLPEEIRGDSVLKPYKSVADVAKDLIGTKRMLGNRIPIPGKDAPADVVQEFRDKLSAIPGVAMMPDPGDKDGMKVFMQKLGMPESADKYDLAIPTQLPDGVQYSEDSEKWFKGVAHAANLTNAQAAAVNNAYLELMGQMAAQHRDAVKAADTQLMKVWGPAYETRKGVANAVINKLYEGDEAESMKQIMTQHPIVMHAFGELGMQMGEASLVRGEGSDGTMTAAELDEQIGQLTASKAYTDNKHQDHKRIVDQVSKLYQKKSEFQAKLRQQQNA